MNKRAESLGISRSDVIIDPLVLTIGADTQVARVTLEATRLIVAEFGVNIAMGASNVSHGLPDRATINVTFIATGFLGLVYPGQVCPRQKENRNARH